MSVDVGLIMHQLEKVQQGRVYLMNSAVMPAGAFGTYHYKAIQPDMFGWYLKHWRVESRIGYAQNINLLRSWFGVEVEMNRTEVELKPGDQMLVMRMKKRVNDPKTKGAPQSSNIEDWEFANVFFE